MNARRLVGLGAGLILFATVGAACSEEVATAEEGDCIESIDFVGGVDELPTTDCDDDHAAQVVGTFDHEGGDDFPGEDEIGEAAQEECADLFEDFVGAPVEETTLGLNTVNPSEDSWEQADDRETLCVAVAGDGSDLDQSVEDAAEDFEGEAGGGSGSGGSGEEQDFSALVEDCEGGDMAACDELYFATPVGSEEERIGATCGGESDEPLNGGCEAQFG